MLKCDNHPDREAMNCSLWALKRYLCVECILAIRNSPRSAARNGRRDWASENEPLWGWNNENHAYLNSNAEYERRRDQHTIDRSKE